MKLKLASVYLKCLFLLFAFFLYNALLNRSIKKVFSKSWTQLLKFIKIQQDLCNNNNKKFLGINWLLAGVSASEKGSGAGTSVSPWQHVSFICSAQSLVINGSETTIKKNVHCSFSLVHTGQIFWACSIRGEAVLKFQQPQNRDVQWFAGAVSSLASKHCQACVFVGTWACIGCSPCTIYHINQRLWLNTALSPELSGSCKGFVIATLKSKGVVLVRLLMFQKGNSEFLISFHCPPTVPLPAPWKVTHVGFSPGFYRAEWQRTELTDVQRSRPRTTNFYELA